VLCNSAIWRQSAFTKPLNSRNGGTMLAAKSIILVLVAVSNPSGLNTLKPVKHGDANKPRLVVPMPVGGALKDGFNKDSILGCNIETSAETGNLYVEVSQDATSCSLSTPSGVFLVVQDGGAAEVAPQRALLIRGELLVKTASLPFTIDNSRHVIDPQLTVAVGIQDSLLLVRSLKGDTEILACGAEHATCSKQVYTLYEGEMLALQNDGEWWAWESDGALLYNEPAGCSTAGRDQGGFLAAIMILIFLTLWRRRLTAA